MKPSRGALFVLALAWAGGCSDAGANLPVPPPRETEPPLPPFATDIVNQRFARPMPIKDAERILVETEIFELAFPGRQLQAFNVVFDQSDALTRFATIAARARWAGQLYSVCAFSLGDPDRARELAQRLQQVREPVYVNQSDWGRERPVVEVVALIQEGNLGEVFRNQRDRLYRYFEELANQRLQPAASAVSSREHQAPRQLMPAVSRTSRHVRGDAGPG
jgi:hypothetical protein